MEPSALVYSGCGPSSATLVDSRTELAVANGMVSPVTAEALVPGNVMGSGDS